MEGLIITIFILFFIGLTYDLFFKKDEYEEKTMLSIIIFLQILILWILWYFLYDYLKVKEELKPIIEEYKQIKKEINWNISNITIDGKKISKERYEELIWEKLMETNLYK